jgi:hypothetical protein
MTKNINFRAKSKEEFDIQTKPYPAVKSLPKWFMDQVPYPPHPFDQSLSDGKIHVRSRASNATYKKCVPLLDGMSAGYIIPLWADVQIEQGEVPEVYWKTMHDVFSTHGETTKTITPPVGYSNQVFKYLNCWIPQTPKG